MALLMMKMRGGREKSQLEETLMGAQWPRVPAFSRFDPPATHPADWSHAVGEDGFLVGV